ncbi:MAG: DUF6036 family nucleotidyltransferase [Pyrinomonadaceae bacterium]
MELDARMDQAVDLHCVGRFVVTILYGLERPTSDVDVIVITPNDEIGHLIELAGKGSELHRKHKVYLDSVTVATYPEDYDQRLTEMFPGAFRHLRLFALDPYDVALSKLDRNIQRDRDDVKYLARIVPFDLGVLKERYEKELRPYLGVPARGDGTMRFWLDMIQEDRSSRQDV